MYPKLVVAAGLRKDRTGGTWKVDGKLKRPKGRRGKSIREQIVQEVAELHGETPRMVTSCWVEYRKATASFRKALRAKQPDPTWRPGKRRKPDKNFDELGPGWEKRLLSQLPIGNTEFFRRYLGATEGLRNAPTAPWKPKKKPPSGS
jgi:hypothetical protein